MAESPAMLLWTDAYLGDTQHLTTLEHGAYLLILVAMWRSGGSLPNDDERLARTAKLRLDRWRKIAPAIMEFMTIEGDRVIQKRLVMELKIAHGKSQKKRLAGGAGGRAKALKRLEQTPSSARGDASGLLVANAYQKASLPVTSNQLPITNNQNREERKKETRAKRASVSGEFDEFWSVYPNRVGKGAAEAAFAKAMKIASWLEIVTGLRRYVNKTDDRPWCNPATWLNQKRWLDAPANAPRPRPRHGGSSVQEIAKRMLAEIEGTENDQISSDQGNQSNLVRLPDRR